MNEIQRSELRTKTYAAFYAMGLLNNASFVIMLAGAKDISEGGTGTHAMYDKFEGKAYYIASLSACILSHHFLKLQKKRWCTWRIHSHALS